MQDLAATILHLRNLWAHAILAAELARGRELGYFSGEPNTELVDPASVLHHVRDVDVRPSDQTPMGRLARRFDLSDAEEHALWLLACCELEPDLAHFAEHLASAGMHQLGVQQVQRMVGISLAELDRLARLGLLELEADPRVPIHRRRLRATDRVLELLRGSTSEDPMLAGIARLLAAPAHTRPPLVDGNDDVMVVVVGADTNERDEAIAASCSSLILHVECAALPESSDARTRILTAIAREARLRDARLLLSGADALLAEDAFYRTVAANVRGPIFASTKAVPLSTGDRPTIVHEVASTDRQGRITQWRAALNDAHESVILECADRYRLPARTIADVGRSLRVQGASGPTTLDAVQLQLRRRLDQRLTGFAKRVSWKQTWDDLVLPTDQFDVLVELVARVRHRQRVIDTWGFGAKVGKGAGTTALFSGPPGTGKTMIAGLLASELGLDLYQADLSKIVSKFIGETEQRLSELFDAAEHGQAIILFDEADSLFGKRTEVRTSNDRYANLETNYLLQRLEAFEGVAILTTNHETAIDPAFMRRLSAHVRIPMPDETHRAKLWQNMLPATAEVRGNIDFDGLAAEFVMSGGYIKNAVLRAAYLAAGEDKPIDNGHFWRAAHAEYEGMGKLVAQPR